MTKQHVIEFPIRLGNVYIDWTFCIKSIFRQRAIGTNRNTHCIIKVIDAQEDLIDFQSPKMVGNRGESNYSKFEKPNRTLGVSIGVRKSNQVLKISNRTELEQKI